MVSRGMVASVALLASGLALSGCVSAPFVSSLESGKLGALRFQSLTVDEEDFLRGRKSGTPVTITGELRLPTTGAERVPAVVLVHGCSGLTSATDGWARELPRFGIATFLVDSFTGRNIREVCTGRDRITTGSRVIDAYRALELLATHPRIDAERIAMMGFSQGGRVALWTAFTRFQTPGVRRVSDSSRISRSIRRRVSSRSRGTTVWRQSRCVSCTARPTTGPPSDPAERMSSECAGLAPTSQ